VRVSESTSWRAQQQIEFGGFLELLDRVDRGVEAGAADNWAVIGQQHRVMLAGQSPRTASASAMSPGLYRGSAAAARPASRNTR